MDAIQEKLWQILKESDALLEGHFRLSSGQHGKNYMQCARLLSRPHHAEWVGQALSHKLSKTFSHIDVVIGMALGGMIIAHEVAKALKKPCYFMERVQGDMCLRRGFSLNSSDKILLIEDVVTTAKSVKEGWNYLKKKGHDIVGIGTIIDRGQHQEKNVLSLLEVQFESYDEDACPQCRLNVPIESPGSRFS